MEQESVCVSEGFAGKANPKLGVKLIWDPISGFYILVTSTLIILIFIIITFVKRTKFFLKENI
jgi:hypothetical protein